MAERDGTGKNTGRDPDRLADRIADLTGTELRNLVELDGGAVGTVYRVDLADGSSLVAKTGSTKLTVEAGMLRFLAAETKLPVPAVQHAADDLLVLEYVPGDREESPAGDGMSPAVERDLAAHVARLHERTVDACGFHFDTLSGLLRQPNPWVDSWIEFFREFRLRYVAGQARERGRLPPELYGRVLALCDDLDKLLVEPDAPALLHGDLWTGNLLVRDDRIAAVLDPAIFYGHPEYDLAYARWTETVGEPFFQEYRERRDLAPGARERFDVYTIHPVVEHVWHFGESYTEPLGRRLAGLGY